MQIQDGGVFYPTTPGTSPGGPLPQARVDYNSAIRVSNRTLDYLKGSPTGSGSTGGGFYRVAGRSGALTTVAAAGPVFSFRWTNAYLICVLLKVKLWWTTTVAFTTAQQVAHSLRIARSFSASDSGGTSLTPAAAMQMKRSSMPASQVADVRISSTAALTAGTRTLDTQAEALWDAWSGAAGAGISQKDPGLIFGDMNEYPIVLAQNEGIIIANDVLMGAAGVISLSVEVAWAEIDPSVLP